MVGVLDDERERDQHECESVHGAVERRARAMGDAEPEQRVAGRETDAHGDQRAGLGERAQQVGSAQDQEHAPGDGRPAAEAFR